MDEVQSDYSFTVKPLFLVEAYIHSITIYGDQILTNILAAKELTLTSSASSDYSFMMKTLFLVEAYIHSITIYGDQILTNILAAKELTLTSSASAFDEVDEVFDKFDEIDRFDKINEKHEETDYDILYAVLIKEDTTYLCLHFTKDHEGMMINTSKLLKTLSLNESRSPEFNLFSDLEEYFEEEVVETMAETME
nr:hypothetical protein [Tanacetum cinerariifolium]